MLKEILSNNKSKNNTSTNKSLNGKEINKIFNNNLNNSMTSFPNTIEQFNRERKRNLMDTSFKLIKSNSKNTTINVNHAYNTKKDASVDSNLQSIDTNFKSYISLNSPNIKNKRSQSTKHFRHNKSQDLNLSNFVDNIKCLEGLITEIKSRGFEATKQEILHKMKSKKEIENRINLLKKKKYLLSQENKNFINNLNKLSNETSNYGMLQERVAREVYYKNKEIPNMVKEINDLKNELFIKKNETMLINTENLKYEKDNNLIKDEIGKMNKEISDIQKEKDNAKSSILLLKKHILIIQEKIIQEDMKSKDFLNNVSIFVDKSLKKPFK